MHSCEARSKNEFKEEIVVETKLKLNCVKTEVDVTETKLPRPLKSDLIQVLVHPKDCRSTQGVKLYLSAHKDLPNPSHISITR